MNPHSIEADGITTSMYLTSFIHRENLFQLTGRWLCNRLEPRDGLHLTKILISDGYVLGDTLARFSRRLLSMVSQGGFLEKRIQSKGELRDMLCQNGHGSPPRTLELIQKYHANPDFFYREAPINGIACQDGEGRLIGIFRIKRPRRIAEKANRYMANWIFKIVQDKARHMAEQRAKGFGVSLEGFHTPPEEMVREFTKAEDAIAASFKEGRVEFDRQSMAINDVGGIKIIADSEPLAGLEAALNRDPLIRIHQREAYQGNYNATSYMLEIPWEPELSCRRFKEERAWERYAGRGIPEEELRKGLDRLLDGAAPTLFIELNLSTFPDMVESELGMSIHEERILTQRGHKTYRGYIPANVEFIIEYLLAVGLSPEVHISELPVKLWGRYLPDTISSHIRRLYRLPEGEGLY
ncbi:MAG: hypothetical protein FJ106_15605 [Deltaproteobacteria bacterium]|nr:hypothetical protein [Deltaproteobacteria bacterium]